MSGPFVRKNALVASASFTPTTGNDQPTSATCVLNFTNLSGVSQQVELPMTSDDNIWSVTWDSSAAAAGPVYWMIFSEGNVQAATEGQFMILANPANNV